MSSISQQNAVNLALKEHRNRIRALEANPTGIEVTGISETTGVTTPIDVTDVTKINLKYGLTLFDRGGGQIDIESKARHDTFDGPLTTVAAGASATLHIIGTGAIIDGSNVSAPAFWFDGIYTINIEVRLNEPLNGVGAATGIVTSSLLADGGFGGFPRVVGGDEKRIDKFTTPVGFAVATMHLGCTIQAIGGGSGVGGSYRVAVNNYDTVTHNFDVYQANVIRIA